MPTLQKTLGTREFTTEALNVLSFRLLSSGLSFQKEGDIVYQLLDQRGRLLISQVAPNFQVGQAIFELYVPFFSRNSRSRSHIRLAPRGVCSGAWQTRHRT